MSDGVRLSARIWLPASAATQAAPAILEYIPYRKRDMVRARDERNHPIFAQSGYVAVRVDMRGSGDSEGSMSDMYTANELDDAIAIVEWLEQQYWCNGSVGMMGTSWGGTSSLQAASRKPAALKAVIAVCANNNRFDDDIHHMGGCLLTDTVEWGATLPAILASPPDPLTVGKQWREIWQHRLEQLSFPLENWVAHHTRDDYWQWGSVNENPDSITCPVLMIGGWADRYSNTVMNFLEQSHVNCWGIVGAWGHHYPDQANPAPGIAFQQEAIRWWDHWLRGVDNNVDKEPHLRAWMQEYVKPVNAIDARPGRWVAEQTWPSNNIRNKTYFVNDSDLVASAVSTGLKSTVPCVLNTGKASGDTGYFGRAGGLPLDQQEDDKLSLVFETEPLQQAIEIMGSVTLTLSLKQEQLSSLLAIRLNDVHPDGTVARVSYVIKNLALNEFSTQVADQNAANDQQITLQFHNTAYRFEADHRVRLALSANYWPIVWPSTVISKMSVLHDSVQLTLPVRNSSISDEYKFSSLPIPAPAIDSTTNYTVRSAPELERWMNTSDDEMRHSVNWQQPLYRVYYPDINLEFGFETTARHEISIDDPCSAVSRFEHALHFSREDWHVMVNSVAELTSTDTHFKLYGKAIVTENDHVVFTREWNPKVKRTCS